MLTMTAAIQHNYHQATTHSCNHAPRAFQNVGKVPRGHAEQSLQLVLTQTLHCGRFWSQHSLFPTQEESKFLIKARLIRHAFHVNTTQKQCESQTVNVKHTSCHSFIANLKFNETHARNTYQWQSLTCYRIRGSHFHHVFIIWDTKFSQWCLERLLSSGMWHCCPVDRYQCLTETYPEYANKFCIHMLSLLKCHAI